MASDTHVRELTSLYALRSDLLNAAGSLAGSLSYAAQTVYSEESELKGFLAQVEDHCSRCRDELYYAEREYEDYCNYTDPEQYSVYQADLLRNNVDSARQRLQQAEENLQQAQRLVEQARQVIGGIYSLASSAAVAIDSDAHQIASAIERAAHEISDYINK